MIRIIVLDFDGVIIESNDAKTEAFRHVFARFPEHLDAMMSFHFENISLSRFDKFRYLVRERLGRGDDPELLGELAASFTEFASARLVKVPFVRGALEFLREFASRVPLYLASVTPEKDLLATVEARRIGEFFRGLYGCPPWTKAGAVGDAIARENSTTGETILVGDSPGDLRAAMEAGVEFVGRDSGIIFHPPLERSYRDMFAIAEMIRERIQ